jgi:hypothetical protein
MAVDEPTVVGDTSWGEATVETGKTPFFDDRMITEHALDQFYGTPR